MKRCLCILFSVFIIANVWCQEDSNRVGVNLGIDGDNYNVGFSYHYMVDKHIGIGGSLGVWGEISEAGLLFDLFGGYDDCCCNHYYNDYAQNTSLYIEPSIVIDTAPIFRIGNAGIGLNITPSVRFSTNHYCTIYRQTGKKWQEVEYKCNNVSFGVSVGPTLRLGPALITLAYKISNLDTNRVYESSSRYTRKPVQGIVFEIAVYL